MSDEEMLKKDMDAMSYKEVLDLLRCHQDLSRFDTNTGESDSLSYMKNCTNDLNYPTYVAISKCIELIESLLSNYESMRKAYGLPIEMLSLDKRNQNEEAQQCNISS